MITFDTRRTSAPSWRTLALRVFAIFPTSFFLMFVVRYSYKPIIAKLMTHHKPEIILSLILSLAVSETLRYCGYFIFYYFILFYSMKLCLDLMQEGVFILRVRKKYNFTDHFHCRLPTQNVIKTCWVPSQVTHSDRWENWQTFRYDILIMSSCYTFLLKILRKLSLIGAAALKLQLTLTASAFASTLQTCAWIETFML